MNPIPTPVIVLLFGLYLASLTAVFLFMKRLIIDLGPDISKLGQPFYSYYCNRGHDLGVERPEVGQLCDECIATGHIRAQCPNNPQHTTHFVDKIPPYRYECEMGDGTFTPTIFTIGSKQVALADMIRANTVIEALRRPLPLDFQVPPLYTDVYETIPYEPLRRLLEQTWLDKIEEAVDQVRREQAARISALEGELEHRQKQLQSTWLPGAVLLSVIALLLTYLYAISNIRVSLSLDAVIETIVTTSASLIRLLLSVLVVWGLLFLATRRIGGSDPTISVSRHIVLVAISTFLAVYAIPTYLFGRTVTVLDMVEGITTDIIVTCVKLILAARSISEALERTKDMLQALPTSSMRQAHR